MLSLFFSACNRDECALGQVRCEDNAAEYCTGTERGGNKWAGPDCGAAFCQLSKEAGSPPFCARTKEPDRLCASSAEFELCQDNEVIGCREGFVEHALNCTTGETFGFLTHDSAPSGHCASYQSSAFCSLEDTPSPLCRGAIEGQACDGDQILSCIGDYLLSRKDCPATGTCTQTAYTYCSLTKAPEPECPPNEPQASFCRNGSIQGCTFGWVTWEQKCDGGTSCIPIPGSNEASCQTR